MTPMTNLWNTPVREICRISLPLLAMGGLILGASGCTSTGFGLGQEATTTSSARSEAMPDQRPADFRAVYGEDGGMAPWSERLEIDGDAASYELWMSDVTYVFDYSPGAPKLDALYDELRLGRFGEYEVIPYEEGEEVYDAGTNTYSVSAGEFSHRLSWSDETLRTPDTDFRPLTALSEFVSLSSTNQATDVLTINYDPAITDLYLENLQVQIDLTGSLFAIGEERWAETFPVNWSGGRRAINVVVLTGSPDDEPHVLVDRELEIDSGVVVNIVRTEDDNIDVQVS